MIRIRRLSKKERILPKFVEFEYFYFVLMLTYCND